MTFADRLTTARLIIAPLFFLIYLFPVSGTAPLWSFWGGGWTIPVLWALFIVSEITDLADGRIARARKEVSDFGKLFDPFADVLGRITYFLCFVKDGILPVFPLLLILYREFGILFVRILMMKKGIAMGANKGGKIKAMAYMITGVAALLAFSANRLGLPPFFYSLLGITAKVIFIISMVIALISFAIYVAEYRRVPKEKD